MESFFECEGRVKPGVTYLELLFSLNEEKRYWKNRLYIHRVYLKCQGPYWTISTEGISF